MFLYYKMLTMMHFNINEIYNLDVSDKKLLFNYLFCRTDSVNKIETTNKFNYDLNRYVQS